MTAFTIPPYLVYAINIFYFREIESKNNIPVSFAGVWLVVIAY